MNKTKIDWCDMSWNPVTGCLHDCTYCYAKTIAKRFGGHSDFDYFINHLDEKGNYVSDECKLHVIEDAMVKQSSDLEGRIAPYPFEFEPTLHKYRLSEPQRKTKSQNIFVCSMADLFGDWVPDEWIQEVFETCEAAQQHRYLFLTKNPKRYYESISKIRFPVLQNFWFGMTVTSNIELIRNFNNLERMKPFKTFLSIEPLQEDITRFHDYKITFDWVIIGAETGNRKGKVIPKKDWIDNIVRQCRKYDVPIFMKRGEKQKDGTYFMENLMGADFVQEFPW